MIPVSLDHVDHFSLIRSSHRRLCSNLQIAVRLIPERFSYCNHLQVPPSISTTLHRRVGTPRWPTSLSTCDGLRRPQSFGVCRAKGFGPRIYTDGGKGGRHSDLEGRKKTGKGAHDVDEANSETSDPELTTMCEMCKRHKQ